MALGSSANSAGSLVGGDSIGDSTLDLVSYDLSKPGTEMDVLASVRPDGGHRFSSIAWGSLGVEAAYPYGVLAGGLQDGTVALWNPHAILQSRGQDKGLIHSTRIHQSPVNCMEFNPFKANLMATCGADSKVKIIDISNPTSPADYDPSSTSKHQGSEVLSCAWNRKVPTILCSCSNTGTTVVWDLKQKKEVISFQDPASRQRCSSVAWNPEVPTQLIVAYDDDRQPSMQMWDLRNCSFPFKETAGHTKGILGVAWNQMDPNLLLSCGKDNRVICWSTVGGKFESFCEFPSQQWNFEVRWAPHKPSIISTASYNGAVSIHSVQQQQTAGSRYCPKWYTKQSGASFGFGGKMLAFGVNNAAKAVSNETTNSYCHSLVVPDELEIVSTADLFEQWIGERKLQEFCHEKKQRCGGGHDGLMWEIMGSQFGETGQQQVPKLLGFDPDEIVQKAEQFLGKRPGTTLMGPSPEVDKSAQHAVQNTPPQAPELDPLQAEDFFAQLTATTEQKKTDELKQAQEVELQQAWGQAEASQQSTTDWASGPEALIKQSLLVGNLTAAVECCFKSGRMAEALLLASGGGTTLWTRARDEYLRLQGDTFLTAVGNIMTNDFQELVGGSNLSSWTETLAIIATYSGDQFPGLCEQLAERLEKEKFDIRSAVICYICAKNFTKTVSIWASTHVASQGSQKLALQDLVEKMTVLQEATRFNQADTLFNAKLTQYAGILANSGRLTAAMRYLCLLRDDASSAILRDRIYNSAPMQMGQLVGRAPPFPYEAQDVRIMYVPQQQAYAPQQPAPHHAAAPAPGPNMPSMPMPNTRGAYPNPGMPPAPAPGPPSHMMGPGQTGPMPSAPRPNTGMPPAPSTGMPPAPNMGGMPPAPYMGGMPPAPNMGGMPPAPNMGGMPPAPSMGGMPPAPSVGGMPPAPNMNRMGPSNPMGGPMGPGPMPGTQPAPGPVPSGGGGGWGAPAAGPGVLPPAAAASPVHNPGLGAGPPRPSTLPTASAMPVTDNMPVSWPLPTGAMSKLATNQTVAAANKAVQEASRGSDVVIGEPMPAHELAQVQSIFGMFLEQSAADGNQKKREDINKRLEELYSKLQAGGVKQQASQKVLALAKALEAQDYAGASKLQLELCTCDWELNKNWLVGVKRLIPTR